MRRLNHLFLSSAALAAMALLTGCATQLVQRIPTLNIDTETYQSVSQDSRAQHLVLHFTSVNNENSIRILTQGPVSSHYLVTEREGDVPPKIYQLVPESRRAYHAGVSHWKGSASLNASSIGIEIVSKGYSDSPSGRLWYDYPAEQIDLVIALCKKIMAEHQIRPDRVLGHSDIAPGRKNDPGPKFPWKRFADEGLIPWPDESMVSERRIAFEVKLPDIAWAQKRLTAHGFNVPVTQQLDVVTKDALEAFQMKYRPAKFDGTLDAHTAALLDVVTSPTGFQVKTEQFPVAKP